MLREVIISETYIAPARNLCIELIIPICTIYPEPGIIILMISEPSQKKRQTANPRNPASAEFLTVADAQMQMQEKSIPAVNMPPNGDKSIAKFTCELKLRETKYMSVRKV